MLCQQIMPTYWIILLLVQFWLRCSFCGRVVDPS